MDLYSALYEIFSESFPASHVDYKTWFAHFLSQQKKMEMLPVNAHREWKTPAPSFKEKFQGICQWCITTLSSWIRVWSRWWAKFSFLEMSYIANGNVWQKPLCPLSDLPVAFPPCSTLEKLLALLSFCLLVRFFYPLFLCPRLVSGLIPPHLSWHCW